jgi:hypothetical protein
MQHEAGLALAISYEVNCHAVDLFSTREESRGLMMRRMPWYGYRYGLDRNISTDPWWARNGARFTVDNHGDEKPGPLFMFERAMPLPLVIKENLIKSFFELDDGAITRAGRSR